MSNKTLWAQSLQGANYQEITEFAKHVPKVLSDASSSQSSDVTREAGLLLTKTQIMDLRHYEATGLALPYTLQDVTDYLRFGAGQNGGAGLRATDFLKTFTDVRQHALRWSPLRERIMITGTELKLFGASMQIYGDSMEEVYLDLKSSALLEKYNIKTVEEFKKLQLDLGGRFPGLELEPDTIPDMRHYLDKIFGRVIANLESVQGIKNDLDAFGYDLRERVLPGIKLRVELIKTNPYPAAIKVLDEVITRRALEIQTLNTQYQALVEKALGAAAGFNVFGLGMAIYYGVEAENVRKERKKLNDAQHADIETLKNQNQTLGSLKRVEHNLQNLTIIAIDADLATQNLMHVWNVMHRYVAESATSVAGITDALSLRRFMTAFREVAAPWAQIHTDADALIQVFREADLEFGQVFQGAVPKVNMFSIVSDYPALNLGNLKASHDAMRDDCVAVQALFTRLNYLPAVFDRFHRMLDGIGAAARGLREASLDSKMDLQSKVRKLLALEKELSEAAQGSDEHDEIKDDLVIALKQLFILTSAEAKRLSSRLVTITDGFDQRTTLGYIPGLEKDLQQANDSKQLSREVVAKYESELKVINDAISAIEKTGIDDIGKNLSLTLEKVQALGVMPPQAQLVLLAIEQLKKSMADISEGITFVSMVHESKRLRGNINEVSQKIIAEDKKISVSAGKLEFIRLIHALDDQRSVYVDEYKRAVAAFARIQEIALRTSSEPVLNSSSAIREAKQFIEFLEPISRP